MTKLNDKVAIVTGASKGIGAAIARALADAGAAVVVNYAGSKAAADSIVDHIVSKKGQAIAVQGDVSKAADVRRLMTETKSTFGGIDILVNCAGIGEFRPLEAVDEAFYHRLFDTNVLGTVLMIQNSLPHFRSGGGSIINIGSLSSVHPTPGASIYSATKGAIDTLTRVLAAELGSRKIRVNTLAPGPVETDGTRNAGLIGSELEKQLKATTPLGRLGQPDDIARVAVFLASDEAGWITGAWIPASGGLR
jgi:3-oxoacyl-[acyl-carrier protein] reductase